MLPTILYSVHTCYRNPHRAEPLGLRRKTSSFHVNFLNNSSIFSILQLIEKDKQKNVHQRLISKILNNWKIGRNLKKINFFFARQDSNSWPQAAQYRYVFS